MSINVKVASGTGKVYDEPTRSRRRGAINTSITRRLTAHTGLGRETLPKRNIADFHPYNLDRLCPKGQA